MQRYDWESGLVYSETTLRVDPRSKQQRDWMHHCDAAPPRYKPSLRGGVESLLDKAIRQLVLNASSLTPETLQAVPKPLFERIWRMIRQQRQESLHVWKLFADSGCGDQTFGHTMLVSQSTLKQPLVDTFSYITSPSHAWIVDLCLGDAVCAYVDLRAVSSISNLRKLEIGYFRQQLQLPLDDRILKGWASQAVAGSAFQLLETIIVFGARGLSRDSFHCLNDFPALECFLAYRTTLKHEDEKYARQHRWTINRKSTETASMAGFLWDSTPIKPGTKIRNNLIELVMDKNGNPIFTGRTNKAPSLRFEINDRTREQYSSNNFYDLDYSALLCLERDRTSNVKVDAPNKRSSVPVQIPQPASKKRKLKDGRAMRLDNLLDNF